MSSSFTSTLSGSVAIPAFAALSLHAESQNCSNPCTTPFTVVIDSSPSILAAGPEPPTRPSSPPDNSITIDKVFPPYKYTFNAPASLKLGPEAKSHFSGCSESISGYHIASHGCTLPYSPPPLSSTPATSSLQHSLSTNDLSHRVIATHSNPLLPLAATPNTSHSFASFSSSPYDVVRQLASKSGLAYPHYKIWRM